MAKRSPRKKTHCSGNGCACADEGGDITVTAAVYVSAALDAELTSITLESDAALVVGATMHYSVAPVRLSSYLPPKH